MSQKKSKSKSKQKGNQKPPKDTKSKKSKVEKPDDKKSKKSLEKSSSKLSKSGSKNIDLKASKLSKGPKQQKGLQESQDISFFKPILTQNLFPLDQSQYSLQLKFRLCQYHKQTNSVFCEICEQPGCQQCLVYGPHNNQMHRITKIDEAFRARYLYLNELVCGELIERRDRLGKRLQELTVMGDQLRYVKNGIEKITRIEYNQMMDRLKIASGDKFAVLHHEMAQLQKDLESINALGNQFFELTNMNPEVSQIPENNPHKGMVPFLLRYRYLQQQAEQLISKPIKISVDVYPYDLPRELTEKKLILDKNRKWIQLLQVKDETIWHLVEEKKNLEKKVQRQFEAQMQTEIQQWKKLKGKITQQLRQYQMVCSKCSQQMSPDNVNDQCPSGQFHEFH